MTWADLTEKVGRAVWAYINDRCIVPLETKLVLAWIKYSKLFKVFYDPQIRLHKDRDRENPAIFGGHKFKVLEINVWESGILCEFVEQQDLFKCFLEKNRACFLDFERIKSTWHRPYSFHIADAKPKFISLFDSNGVPQSVEYRCLMKVDKWRHLPPGRTESA